MTRGPAGDPDLLPAVGRRRPGVVAVLGDGLEAGPDEQVAHLVAEGPAERQRLDVRPDRVAELVELRELPVLREPLPDGIVHAIEHGHPDRPAGVRIHERPDVGAERAAVGPDEVQAWVEDVDREEAVGPELVVDQSERRQLVVGLQDRHEHAKRREHEPEPLARGVRGHVALDEAQPPRDVRPGRLGLGPGPGEHPGRSVDPDDVEPGLRERDRHPPGAATQLEDRATGLLRERPVERDVITGRDDGSHRVVDRDVERRRRVEVGRRLAHVRRIGRVRHVGPPEPFSPTSPSGIAWTSTPAASRPRRVAGLPSATITTPGRTASTLQPSVGYSSSGTSTSRMPRAAHQLPQPHRQERQVDDREVVGDRRHDREEVDELGRALASTGRRRSARRRRRSARAGARRRRSSGASARCRAGPAEARTCRRPRSCPGASIRPAVGMPAAVVHASRTAGSPARFGLAGTERDRAAIRDQQRVEVVDEVGVVVAARLVEDVDRHAQPGQYVDERVVLAAGPIEVDRAEEPATTASSNARPNARPGPLTRTSRQVGRHRLRAVGPARDRHCRRIARESGPVRVPMPLSRGVG